MLESITKLPMVFFFVAFLFAVGFPSGQRITMIESVFL